MKTTIALPVNRHELHTASLNISNEALSINLPNRQLLVKLTDLVSDSTGFIKSKISSIAQGITQSRRDSYLSYRFSKKLAKIPYVDLMDIQLPTPEGLKSNYVDYAKFLHESQQTTARLYDDFLHPFSQWVSSMVQRPESVDEITNQIREFDFTDFEKAEAEFPKHVSGISGKAPYNALFRNNNEWDELEDLLKQMVERDRRQPRELVVKKIKDISELLNTLMTKMADPNGSYRPSPKVIKDLSDLTYKLAEHVAFYSIIEAALDSLIVAVKDAKEDLTDAIKKL